MRANGSIVLEKWGEGSYLEYRIPGIVTTPSGTILCCYEARMADNNDWAGIDIILRRSVDGGRTFSRQIIVQNYTDEITTFNNPLLIADGDLIHFIWHRNYAQAFYQVSRDDGCSFSEPKEITGVFDEFRTRYDWTVNASGPGHGIALQNGRLVVPIWLAQGRALDASGRVRAHQPSVAGTIFSDDHGATWHSGSIVEDILNGNETTAVELSDGKVLLNIRHHEPVKCRGFCISPDGAGSFGKPLYDLALPDPMCFGSLIRIPGHGIGFVNCANNRDRERINLTLRLSQDDCRSWPEHFLVDPIGGYADLAYRADKTVYCFYEQTVIKNGKGVIDQLVLTRISL